MIARARAHLPNGVPMAWMALVQAQLARSTQFLLPTEASVEVAEELARRYPVPQWQFTLSASQANTEAIRLTRAVTGREVVVLFQGHYHGHFEEALVDLADGQVAVLQRGLSKGVTGRVRIAQFNDPGTLRAALEPGDVALVLTEPAMTNNLHLRLPEPGWHQALRDLTRQHGTLLALDETHTHVVGPGGATAMWNLDPDMVTIGKAVAGGLPMGAYGVTAELGGQLDADRNLATGGTLFGNPLSAAAARAALTQVLVPSAYVHTTALGGQLADGIEQAIKAAGLPWTVIRLGPRSVLWYGPVPSTGAASACAHRQPAHPPDPDLARQPRHLGRTARRRPHRPGPRRARRRDPLPRGLQRATGPAALTPCPTSAATEVPYFRVTFQGACLARRARWARAFARFPQMAMLHQRRWCALVRS